MTRTSLSLAIVIGCASICTACAGALEPTAIPSVPPTEGIPPATPSITTVTQLPEADEVVLRIPNEEPFSGKEGDPRPDWLGWGAATFTFAPDGTIWIADTAVWPHRLLHFDVTGVLLQSVSLEGIAVSVSDLLATGNGLWVLDLSSQPPRLVRLGKGGQLEFCVDIPDEPLLHEGHVVANGVFNIWLGERGEILSSGINGLHALISASGEVLGTPIQGFSFHGHTYRVVTDPTDYTFSIEVDGTPLVIEAPDKVEAEPFLGFNPDGSFALAVYRTATIPGDPPSQGMDRLVNYYALSGQLRGVARLRPQFMWGDPLSNHDLAFGTEGFVYQLVSYPDHSVEVVRLAFAPGLPPMAEAEPIPTATPLTLLLPSWTTPPSDAGDEQRAREALVSFFTLLHEGRYGEAGRLYGGTYDELALPGPREQSGEVGAYWQTVCQQFLCLPVADIAEVQRLAEDEFLFYVVFMWEDGRRFELGVCCGGNPAESPPVWQFAYPVRRMGGEWKITRGPLYMP